MLQIQQLTDHEALLKFPQGQIKVAMALIRSIHLINTNPHTQHAHDNGKNQTTKQLGNNSLSSSNHPHNTHRDHLQTARYFPPKMKGMRKVLIYSLTKQDRNQILTFFNILVSPSLPRTTQNAELKGSNLSTASYSKFTGILQCKCKSFSLT